MNNRALLIQINHLTGASFNSLRDIPLRHLLLLTIALLLTLADGLGVDPADPQANTDIAKIWRQGK